LDVVLNRNDDKPRCLLRFVVEGLYIIKLGGSVITDKSKYKTPRTENITRLAREIAESGSHVIIIHGAGSYGHIIAKKHRLHDGYKSDDQYEGFAKVQKDVRELNLLVLNALHDAGIHAASIPPGNFTITENRAIQKIDTTAITRLIEIGQTPVTFGDIVLDESLKFSICSGDVLMLRIACELKIKRAIFVTDVDGILVDRTPAGGYGVLANLECKDDLLCIHKPVGTVDDVTGSIMGKADVMLKLIKCGTASQLINGTKPGNLRDALEGKTVLGTRAEP
jgi:isopentenyl phosphate kinase